MNILIVTYDRFIKNTIVLFILGLSLPIVFPIAFYFMNYFISLLLTYNSIAWYTVGFFGGWFELIAIFFGIAIIQEYQHNKWLIEVGLKDHRLK